MCLGQGELGVRHLFTHLHGKRFEPDKTKVLDKRAYSHVQSRIAW